MSPQQTSHETLEKSYPSVIQSEAVMFDDIERFLLEHAVPENKAQDVKLCVSEAFTNAALHGNRLDPSKKVKLRLSANHNSVVADIIDEGQGGIADIQKRRKPSPLDETGRGINLMYGRADEVTLSAIETGGLCVRLVFAINSPSSKDATKKTIQ